MHTFALEENYIFNCLFVCFLRIWALEREKIIWATNYAIKWEWFSQEKSDLFIYLVFYFYYFYYFLAHCISTHLCKRRAEFWTLFQKNEGRNDFFSSCPLPLWGLQSGDDLISVNRTLILTDVSVISFPAKLICSGTGNISRWKTLVKKIHHSNYKKINIKI